MAEKDTGRPRARSPRTTSGVLGIINCMAAYALSVLVLTLLSLFWAVSKLKLALLQHVLRIQLDILSGLDAAFWYSDPTCQQVVTTVLVVKGKPEVGKLRALLQERLVDATGSRSGGKRYPRFTQHVVRKYGYLVWEDDKEFTMDHRVTLWATGYNDATLMALLQKMYERPLARGHSPWEVVLLPRDEEGEYVLLLRIFHILGDGVQMLRICESLFDRSKQGSSPNTYYDDVLHGVPVSKMPVQFQCNPFLRYLRNPGATVSNKDRRAILINGLKTAFMAPWVAIELAFEISDSSLYQLQLHALVALLAGRKQLSFTGRKLLSFTARIDLQRFKTVTDEYGCTINDVYLHCLTGAYQRCNSPAVQGGPPAQAMSSKSRKAPLAQELPTYVKMAIPINVLPDSGFWGENCCTGLLLILPSSGADAAARLLEISRHCHIAKSSTAATAMLLLISGLGNHLPSYIAKFIFDLLDMETGATNLRGPGTAATLADAPVTDMFLAVNNFANSAVVFSFLSYSGGARIGVTVDGVAAPDDGIAQRIADNFVEELDNLVEQALSNKKIV